MTVRIIVSICIMLAAIGSPACAVAQTADIRRQAIPLLTDSAAVITLRPSTLRWEAELRGTMTTDRLPGEKSALSHQSWTLRVGTLTIEVRGISPRTNLLDDSYGHVVTVSVGDSVVAERVFTQGKQSPGQTRIITLRGDGNDVAILAGPGRQSHLCTVGTDVLRGDWSITANRGTLRTDLFAIEQWPDTTDKVYDDTAISAAATARGGVCGIWQYLDKTVDPSRAQVGGTYRLAIIATTKGHYDIVYLDGAEKLPDNWHRGMTKGHLCATTFADTYDLEWYDAERNPVQSEAYATLTAQGSILQLTFPLHEAALRLKRAETQAEQHAVGTDL